MRKAEDVIFQLRSENQKQREKLHELRANMHKSGGAAADGASASAEVHKLTLERRQLLKEKANLEQQVVRLHQRGSFSS